MTDCIRQPTSTWTRCKCPKCIRGRNRVRRANDAGLIPPTRSDEAWAVLDDLVHRGWNQAAIASAAGVKPDLIHHLIVDDRRGHRATMRRHTAHAILNHGNPTVGHIGALGATRRLQALSAIGWTQGALAAETGLAPMTVNVIRNGSIKRTSWDKHQAVADTFNRLAMTPGLSQQARRFAAAHGWAPPLAWDDIDDPDEQLAPDGVADDTVDLMAVDVAVQGTRPVTLTRPERHLAVTRLTHAGLNDHQIAHRVGVTPETVLRDRQHLGLASPTKEAA